MKFFGLLLNRPIFEVFSRKIGRFKKRENTIKKTTNFKNLLNCQFCSTMSISSFGMSSKSSMMISFRSSSHASSTSFSTQTLVLNPLFSLITHSLLHHDLVSSILECQGSVMQDSNVLSTDWLKLCPMEWLHCL